MAVSQAAASAALAGGGALSAVSSNSTKDGGVLSSRTQIGCSARPRSVVPMQQGSISVSSLFSSPLERTPSRTFSVAGENSVAKLDIAPVVEEEEEKEIHSVGDLPAEPSPEASVSAFMADVANLVKLVDSRDIVELELKNKEFEIVIRKESRQPPPPPMTFPGPHVMAHTSFPGYAPAPPPPTPAPAPAAIEPAPVAAAAPAPAPPAKPSHPPMLSPMAGTFYRSPGPGESAFVQVGDKVIKGQVVCIVEAMKLMNEIEADQSGTIVEILAEDGKPCSIESPLFSIKP